LLSSTVFEAVSFVLGFTDVAFLSGSVLVLTFLSGSVLVLTFLSGSVLVLSLNADG
jgi:hypothetical protein